MPSISNPATTVAFEATGSPGGQFTIGAALGVAGVPETARAGVIGAVFGVVVGVVDVVVVLVAAGCEGPSGGPVGVVFVVELGGSATVSDVAQGSPGEHVPPCRVAAVVNGVPAGTSAATEASNEILSGVLAAFSAFDAGRVQVSVIALGSRMRPWWARSVPDVVTLP